ncbi:DUF2878 domain-containing protein [Gallaecimonas xiamenensis]|uniref:DUF2878 domain-containing protein n=1 Tax=Gallaecimonas xiamenensis 3-C-1 TaxID=745411 RepID=K2K1P1_9GAMM|nr:DUF2878 domain-containing protein [Gallaecimonas xiamenensis]EKE76719.1 hypothetical protein B3C1_03960 [Gallaecimonas xiamenensis 3-C-1]
MHWLLNLALFQLAWLGAVLWQSPWPALGLLALHLLLSPRRQADARLMVAFLLVGLIVDGGLGAAGFLVFEASPYVIPTWLMALWAALAMLPNHSLAWLKYRPWLSALLGAIGGAFAYWGGVRLGAAQFGWPLVQSLATLALVWGGLWPLLMLQSRRWCP